MNASMKKTTKISPKDTKPHLIYACKSIKQQYSTLRTPFHVENPCSFFSSTIVDVAPLAYDVPTKGKKRMMGSRRILEEWFDKVVI